MGGKHPCVFFMQTFQDIMEWEVGKRRERERERFHIITTSIWSLEFTSVKKMIFTWTSFYTFKWLQNIVGDNQIFKYTNNLNGNLKNLWNIILYKDFLFQNWRKCNVYKLWFRICKKLFMPQRIFFCYKNIGSVMEMFHILHENSTLYVYQWTSILHGIKSL